MSWNTKSGIWIKAEWIQVFFLQWSIKRWASKRSSIWMNSKCWMKLFLSLWANHLRKALILNLCTLWVSLFAIKMLVWVQMGKTGWDWMDFGRLTEFPNEMITAALDNPMARLHAEAAEGQCKMTKHDKVHSLYNWWVEQDQDAACYFYMFHEVQVTYDCNLRS